MSRGLKKIFFGKPRETVGIFTPASNLRTLGRIPSRILVATAVSGLLFPLEQLYYSRNSVESQ
jgi:hypothetical protein